MDPGISRDRPPQAPVSDKRPTTLILGGGVAGLAAAWALAADPARQVILLESAKELGGLAASVNFHGATADLGSHRIHPGYLPAAWTVLRQLLGDELQARPRQGRLRLNGRYLDYPPSLSGLIGALGVTESLSCAVELLRAKGRHSPSDQETYEDALVPLVGRRLFERFYAPYARKVYGLEPQALSSRAAHVRFDRGKRIWQVLAGVARRVMGRGDSRVYYYPRRGFGSIAAALELSAKARGAQIRTGVVTQSIGPNLGDRRKVIATCGSERHEIDAQVLISTIPIHALIGLLRPSAPEEVIEAARGLRWRGIRLIQVLLETKRALSHGETYYFPEERFAFGRISEPSQYSPDLAPGPDRTLLNIEVICSPGDEVWRRDEAAFASGVLEAAERVGVLRRDQVLDSRSLFLPAVYPVYDLSSGSRLERSLQWIESHGDVYSIGRGGLFLHANADHSIALGLQLAAHLKDAGASHGWRDGLQEEAFKVRD